MLPSISRADGPSDWDRFRGPGGRGIAAGQLPATWSADDYRWRVNVGGRDVGSMIGVDGDVVLMTSPSEGEQIGLTRIEGQTGRQLWSVPHAYRPRKQHQRSSTAQTTPTTDGERIYAAWADADGLRLTAVDLDGQTAWTRDFGYWEGAHGFGGSPAVIGDSVVLFDSGQRDKLEPGQRADDSHMRCVDAATGADRWATPLNATRPCYGTPLLVDVAGAARQIVAANKGNGIFGLDPADGGMLWSIDGLNQRCVSSPQLAITGDGPVILASAGSGGGGNRILAVTVPPPGQSPREVYRIDRSASYVPTPLVVGENLIFINDGGIATCADVASGKTRWSLRLGGNFGASPIVVGDEVLAVSLDGIAHVFAASSSKPKVRQIDLGGSVGATPAVIGGALILRVGSEVRSLDLATST